MITKGEGGGWGGGVWDRRNRDYVIWRYFTIDIPEGVRILDIWLNHQFPSYIYLVAERDHKKSTEKK